MDGWLNKLAMVVLPGVLFCAVPCECAVQGPAAGPVSASGTLNVEVNMKTSDHKVRKTQGDGRWFPADGKVLAAKVAEYIEKAEIPVLKGRLIGVIAPHAGYEYSGKVAGYSFAALKKAAEGGNRPDTVVVLGFSHRAGFHGISLMDGDAVRTPMGDVAIDMEAVRFLVGRDKSIVADYSLFGAEHSAENEIPFVQAALPGVKIVVGLIGDHDTATLETVVAALGALSKEKKIVVVASSDMLHDPNYDLVARTDKATLEKVAALDYKGVAKSWSFTNQVFCGIMPVLTVMKFAEQQGCRTATVLHYRNSGDDFPESRGNWVVGYGSVAFVAPE